MRRSLIDQIVVERERQFNLPGSEFDLTKSPNDWIAVASYYLSENAARLAHSTVRAEDFEDSLTKAAAVILAALEHVEHMKKTGSLT